MAQVIKIKRSDSSANPGSNLAKGELGYSYNSNKLFIGDGSTYDVIGGQTYVEMLDHAAGTLTASSAIIVGPDSKIDNLLVDNLQLNGNTISTGSGNLIIDPATGSIDFATGGAIEFDIVDGSATAFTISEGNNNYLTFDTTNDAELITFNKQLEIGLDGTVGYTLPTADGSNGQALITNGSGAVSFQTISTTLGIAGDSSSSDSVNLVSDTLTFTGSGTVSATVASDTVTIGVSDATTSAKGLASFASANFTVSSGAVSAKDITLSSDSGSAAATIGETFTVSGGSGISTSATGTTVTVAADTGTASAKGIVIVAGGTGLTASYSAGTVTLSGDNATTSSKGIASFNSNDFSVSNGAVSIGSLSNAQLDNPSLTIGSTSVSLGAQATSLAGLTNVTATGVITGGSLVADNITVNGNEISSTDGNGDISLNPNGSGVVDVNNSRISNVTDPTQAQDAATKAYVDAVKQALDIKDSVHVATTGNITLSGTQTIDGIDVEAGDRVLVKNQTAGADNGIYVAAGGAWSRATDANTSSEVTPGMFVFVEEGTANGDNGFVLTTDAPITLDTTSLTFTQFSGAGQITAGDGLSKSGNTLSVDDDNITLVADGTSLRIKGISTTAVGDLLIGAASNGGYTRLAKPASNNAFLTMGTAGTASWTTTIDGGTF